MHMGPSRRRLPGFCHATLLEVSVRRYPLIKHGARRCSPDVEVKAQHDFFSHDVLACDVGSWQDEHRVNWGGARLDFLPSPGGLHVQPPAEVADGAEAARPHFPPPRAETGPSARWERRRAPRYVVECTSCTT